MIYRFASSALGRVEVLPDPLRWRYLGDAEWLYPKSYNTLAAFLEQNCLIPICPRRLPRG